MKTHLQFKCVDCGAVRGVRRHELDRAAKPRCLTCGGRLEPSASAAQKLAGVAGAQRGQAPPADKRRKPPAPPPVVKIIPEKETTRYEFWEHPDMWRWMLKDQERLGRGKEVIEGMRAIGPAAFYDGIAAKAAQDVEGPEHFGSRLINLLEKFHYLSGRPYYKVWPSIASALCHTDMRVDGEHFRLPYKCVEVRFPKGGDNPMLPVTAVLGARLENDDERFAWEDDREWTFAVCFFDNVPEFQARDDCGKYWLACIPIRKGLSLEDALDQTQLMKEVSNPELCRRVMRVMVGVAFFGLDEHEVILPEVRRKVIDRYLAERRQPTPEEASEALADARKHGMGSGFKVGSELLLPSPEVRTHGPGTEGGPGEGRGGLEQGHIRRGHMRMQPHGEKRAQRKLIFIAPHVVRPDLPLAPSKGHKVKLT